MYDQWIRDHDCVAQQYNDCNDRAYELETARIKTLCEQHQIAAQQVVLEEQTAGQAAPVTAMNQIAQKPRRERPEHQARTKQVKRVSKGRHTFIQVIHYYTRLIDVTPKADRNDPQANRKSDPQAVKK